MPRQAPRPFAYAPPPELAGGVPSSAPVAIVGAGPVGLAAAIDLALHGVATVVLDDNDVVSAGSRAICWAKRTLEIFDRLGVAERMVAKGVTWKVGRLFHGDREVWSFDLLPEAGHKMPAFINLQQYYVEQYLAERCADFPRLIDLRWKNRLTGLEPGDAGVWLRVETPDGGYRLRAGWLLACDGAKSAVRDMLGLAFEGRSFEDRFLIADVEMQAAFPNERRFWFRPTFHPGQTALLHKQPDDIWRVDLQLGADADPEVEKRPENVIPRIARAVGGRRFRVDWVSVYGFRCARLERFVHGRVIFAGDSAHVVSPFGARGGNGGIHDVDNLGWKLAMVVCGEAGPALLASYDEERVHAAAENIRHSEHATAFISPRGAAAARYRDAVLALSADMPFARRLINSGRLSDACSLAGMRLQTPDAGGAARLPPGSPCPDARLAGGGWLLERLGGRFVLLGVGRLPPATGLPTLALPAEGAIAERYGSGVFLVRPDQHVAACWADPAPAAVRAAVARATAAEEAP
jgi:3-(3-hydroxy-phenyl)propionate hydroxylase